MYYIYVYIYIYIYTYTYILGSVKVVARLLELRMKLTKMCFVRRCLRV